MDIVYRTSRSQFVYTVHDSSQTIRLEQPYEKVTTCNVFADVLYVHARAHDYINFIELE